MQIVELYSVYRIKYPNIGNKHETENNNAADIVIQSLSTMQGIRKET